MKRKVTGIFLLFCLVAPAVVTYTWFHYKKGSVRKEIKKQIIAGVDREALVLVKLTKEEARHRLNWKHSKEFEYNEEMYDVVETEIKGNIVYYWCWWDHKETGLNRQLNELLARAMGSDQQTNNNQQRLKDFFKTLIFCKAYSIAAIIPQTGTEECSTETTYRSMTFPPPVPPPLG